VADTNLRILVTVAGGQAASAELKGVAVSTEEVGAATATTSKRTGGLMKSLKGVAAGIAVYKGYQWIKGAVSTTESLAKSTAGLQRITGLDTKTAAGWVATAQERGVQAKQLNLGFTTLGRQMASAAKGSKATVGAFNQLGISQAQLGKMNTQQTMSAIADGLSKLPPGAEKAALAQKLFGRSAQGLLPLLNGGSKALNEQVTAMGKQTGMTDKTMKSSLAMAKQQRELNATMLGLKVAVGTALVPILTQLAQLFVPVITAFATMIRQSGAFRTAILILTPALVAMFLATKLGLEGIQSVGMVGIIFAIITALVLLYQKCAWFRAAVQAAMRGAQAAFNWVKTAAVNVFNWVAGHWPLLVSILGGPIAAAAVQIAKHWSTITAAAQSVWHFLQGLGNFIGGAFAAAWHGAVAGIQAVADAINAVINAAKTVASLPGKAGSLVSKGLSGAGKFLGIGQHGGTVPHNMPVLVGEKGPEIVALPGGSTVIPNHALGLAGGGVIHTHVYLQDREIAHAIGNYTADRQAAR
jgi:hypothetical protein